MPDTLQTAVRGSNLRRLAEATGVSDTDPDAVDRPGDDRTGADRTGADPTGADRTSADRTGIEQAGGGRPADDRAEDGRPADGRAEDGRVAGVPHTGDRDGDAAARPPETDDEGEAVRRYRSIWISDVHLGTKACKADFLLDFLRHTDSDHLYLVGDIVDGWRLKKTWYWPQAHNDVVQKLLRKARKGTQVYYIPGNHDEGARQFCGQTFGSIQVENELIHEMADGRRFLVIHGDQFDVVVRHMKWLAHIGDWAYVTLLACNTGLNWVRRKMGFSYWSLSAYLKSRTKKAVEFVSRYETALADEARRQNLDGVICGHIHTAEFKDMFGLSYCNDGDWVESCTALVEHYSGELELIQWTDGAQRVAVLPVPSVRAAAA